MDSIQEFINLGWHTVPLKGKLERLEDGSKTTPIFSKDWKSKYQIDFNETATEIGGVITGAISGIIAIDCDNTNTYNLFRSLDPNYSFVFVSRGKLDKEGNPKNCGTIVYKYSERLPETFSLNNKTFALDFYSDNGFVYLPTSANKTKDAWDNLSFTDFPELKEPPEAVIMLLNQLHQPAPQAPLEDKKPLPQAANYLGPQIELFLAKKQFIPGLFRIITPKDFRNLPQYVQNGYLHPDQVPEGRGSEYLSKISAILGADASIDEEMYNEAMLLINDLWDYPIPKKRLDDTILEPMVSGKASINGDPIWKYDKYWKTRGFLITTKRGSTVEVFFDDRRAVYYVVDLLENEMKLFFRDAELFSYIEAVGVTVPSKKEMKTTIPLVHVTADPSKPFGFSSPDEYSREFNNFAQTPSLAILNEPDAYAANYSYPKTVLNFFQTLVPDNPSRHYLLRFIKRKLTTFEYSPVVLYFLGVPGSGKDTLVKLLETIIGSAYLARPTTREFLEMYNGWMVDKYFAQLDEFGNQLVRFSDKEEALGKIKAYTGKQEVQIRQMRTDGFNYRHNITFIMTANLNPLMLEEDDRRIALFDTPNMLKSQEWVKEAGGISEVINKIQREIPDFCYYLAKEIDALSADDYSAPPESDSKKILVASKLPAAQRLVFYIKGDMHEQLEDLAHEYEYPEFLDYWNEGRIYDEDMYMLYSLMTDGQGTKQGLTKAMRNAGLDKTPTTKGGQKAYFYHIPALQYHKLAPFQSAIAEKVNIDVGGI